MRHIRWKMAEIQCIYKAVGQIMTPLGLISGSPIQGWDTMHFQGEQSDYYTKMSDLWFSHSGLRYNAFAWRSVRLLYHKAWPLGLLFRADNVFARRSVRLLYHKARPLGLPFRAEIQCICKAVGQIIIPQGLTFGSPSQSWDKMRFQAELRKASST